MKAITRFSQEWIEKIKSSVDIVEVIGEWVDLKPAGNNYVGLCPFHDEKTPSFSVNQEKQFFYCFGCQAGGNVFNFIMRMENLTFPEAVRFLAKRKGIALPAVSAGQRKKEEKKAILRNINELAARYYYRNLRAPAGERARQYLLGRGIEDNLAREFYLGYALSDWQGLSTFLQGEGVDLKTAQEAGLLIEGQRGYLDRFRDRVIFPICDHLGRFVAFGARSLGGQEPKYLNSPQTMIFNKGTTMYGLNWSKDAIRQHGQVVIVEGYTDYISLVARGVKNVAASLGTAFTQGHARLLKRFGPQAIIAFDGDASGERATLRSLDILSENGLQVKVAVLKAGEDPDSFARSHPTKEVQRWLANAIPLREYQMDLIISKHDIKTREGKLAASTELVNILGQLKNAVERDEYTDYCAQKLGVSKEALQAEVVKKAGISSHRAVQTRHNKSVPKKRDILGDSLVEREILRWLLHKPQLLSDLQKRGVSPGDFEDEEYRHLFSLIMENELDKRGSEITKKLFNLGELSGSWAEYLQSFLNVLRKRRLQRVEGKLSSLENEQEGSDVRMELYRLLQEYYRISRSASE